MKKFLPVIIAVFGLGGGLAAGTVLKPDASVEVHEGDDHVSTAKAGDSHESDHGDKSHGGGDDGHGNEKKPETIYVGLEKPFFAPVLHYDNRQTLVRLDIHLEIPPDLESVVQEHDPKLRDGFLRTVMNFAHDGGFTRVHDADGFAILRDDLLLTARSIIGDEVRAVLIGEILTRKS
jgi:hypothetical protein